VRFELFEYLEEAKNQLIISNAKMKQELKEIEDRILLRLSSSEGSPVDDIDLINTLDVLGENHQHAALY
jgi:dynein heavy chain